MKFKTSIGLTLRKNRLTSHRVRSLCGIKFTYPCVVQDFEME